MGIPVITTPISVLPELGFEENKDGYVVPFDMVDVRPERFLEVPTAAAYKGDTNEAIQNKWIKLLGKSKPTGEYLKQGNYVKVEIIESYFDMELNRNMTVGEVVTMRKARAILIVGCGKAVIVR